MGGRANNKWRILHIVGSLLIKDKEKCRDSLRIQLRDGMLRVSSRRQFKHLCNGCREQLNSTNGPVPELPQQSRCRATVKPDRNPRAAPQSLPPIIAKWPRGNPPDIDAHYFLTKDNSPSLRLDLMFHAAQTFCCPVPELRGSRLYAKRSGRVRPIAVGDG